MENSRTFSVRPMNAGVAGKLVDASSALFGYGRLLNKLGNDPEILPMGKAIGTVVNPAYGELTRVNREYDSGLRFQNRRFASEFAAHVPEAAAPICEPDVIATGGVSSRLVGRSPMLLTK